jgi:MATE family multidrug resistance protein
MYPFVNDRTRQFSINREILRLAIPNILSNVSIPLLGMADTAFMGRLDSEIYIGAVALGSVLFNFIYWGFGFLRMGTTGLTAQAFGANDDRECSAILGRGLLVALSSSIAIIALQYAIARLGFSLLQGDAAVESLAREYFLIRIYAAPATLGLYVLHGWFLGMQNARYPMWLTVFVNTLNVLFNIFFVFQMGMKADGVALGTVCAQYLGLALAVGLFLHKYRLYLASFKRSQILRLKAVKRFFAVNGDIFIRTISLVFAFAFFTSASAALGSMILAANQILLQYLSLMSYAVDGFAFAAESLVGRFVGAKDLKTLKLSVRLLFVWGCGFGAVFAAAYVFFGKTLLRVFTDQPDIIKTAIPYFWWTAIVTLAGSVAYLWDGVYIGATATVPMRNMMLLATFGVFLPSYYLFISPLGNHGLWLSMSLFMVARALSLGLLAKKNIFKFSNST